MITFTELRGMLGITQPALSKLIRDGLPFEIEDGRKKFDEEIVARWLILHGYAEENREEPPEPAGLVCTTRKEAAEALGVSVRYLSEWLNEPGFPGHSGSPGRQDGYFPIAEIEAWRRGRPQYNAATDPVKDIRAKILTLEYQEKLENVVRLDMYEAFIMRTLSAFKANLEPLEDVIVARLPPEIDEKTRRDVQKIVADTVETLLNTLVELVQGDQDEVDDIE